MNHGGFRNYGERVYYLVLIVRNHTILNYNVRLRIGNRYTDSFLWGWHDEFLTAKNARHFSDGGCFFPRSEQ